MSFDLKHSISSLDSRTIHRCFESIRCADLKRVSIDELKEKLRPVMEAYAMFPVEVESDKLLYRAVKHKGDEKRQYVRELTRLYPHPDYEAKPLFR